MSNQISMRYLPASTRRQRGVTSIEYALIGSLIAVAIVVAVAALGVNLGALYDNVANKVAQASGN